MVDKNKIITKIGFLKENLKLLEEIKQLSFEEFLSDQRNLHTTIRLLQTSVEAMLDIANHIVARKNLRIPQTYRDSIEILTEAGILPVNKVVTYSKMIQFRNRVIHLYDKVDEKEIYRILQKNLGDFKSFINSISKNVLK